MDNTGSQYMPGSWVAQGASAKNHGDFEIDGAQYTVYEGDRTSYSIDGDNKYFKQYFSVRKSKRDCGTIDITAHFKKWEELGMKMGKMHEAKILGEAGSNSGANAKGEYDFPYAKVYIEGAEQSSSSAEPESSSSTDAIKGIRSMTVGSNTLLVFDAQGKYLGSFEAADAESLNAAIKAKHNSGVYMVKQGRAVRSISVK